MNKEPITIESVADMTRFQIAQVGNSYGRDRWTVLTVLYIPCLEKPWVGQVRHRSVLVGEDQRTRRFSAIELEDVLNRFDDTELKDELELSCDIWMNENHDLIERLEEMHSQGETL